MITAKCDNCGGTFHLDDSMAGRRAKCKRCGSVFTIPDADPFTDDSGLLAIAGEDDLLPPEASSPLNPNAPVAAPEEAPFVLSHAASPEKRAQARQTARNVVTEPTRSFWADAAMSFIVPLRGWGVFAFGFVILLMLIQAFFGLFGCFGLPFQLLIWGYLGAYYFLVIRSSCAGEDRLPGFEFGGWWEGIILPALAYFGTSLWAGWPFLTCSIVLFRRGYTPTRDEIMLWFGLMGLYVFIWPMTVLTVAIQGFSVSMLRYDKQLLTIGRSFLPYVAICGLLAALTGLTVAVMMFGLVLGPINIPAVVGPVIVLNAYFSLVTMRLIGLFYHHNKHRFAWQAE